MSKRVTAIIVGLAVLVIGGLVVFGLTRPPAPTEAGPSVSQQPESEQPSTDSSTDGIYVDYDDSAIAAADGRVLLFFHAPWCPQCLSIEEDILAGEVPTGVTIIKVDYDSNQDLRQQYGVTLQTTFVEVDSDGTELQKHVAYQEPQLDAVITAMI